MNRTISKSILVLLSLMSCAEPEEKKEELPDYSHYNSMSSPGLWGEFNNEDIRWNFGTTFQMGQGVFIVNENCDGTGRIDFISFFQIMSDGFFNVGEIYSPAFDDDDPEWSKKQFELNSKWKTGHFLDDFKVVITHEGKFYETNNLTTGEVQVLKVVNLPNHVIRVWLGVHTELSSCGCDCLDKPAYLKNAVFVAEFLLDT